MGAHPVTDQELFDKFVGIYNQLDAYMRRQQKVDKHADHGYLIQQMSTVNKLFGRYEQELKTLAHLRNVLVHSPFMHVAHPMAKPSPAIIERYQQILNELLNPPRALTIAVPASKLYTTSLAGNALGVIKEMCEKTYTHVPVLEDDKMIGVFSENSLLAYLAHNEDSIITRDYSISEFKDFIGLDKHPSESYEFVSRNTYLTDIYALFNAALKIRRRIGVVFVTEHGKPDEKLLGIITAWDLASPEF